MQDKEYGLFHNRESPDSPDNAPLPDYVRGTEYGAPLLLGSLLQMRMNRAARKISA